MSCNLEENELNPPGLQVPSESTSLAVDLLLFADLCIVSVQQVTALLQLRFIHLLYGFQLLLCQLRKMI